jgi:hypothetical protein
MQRPNWADLAHGNQEWWLSARSKNSKVALSATWVWQSECCYELGGSYMKPTFIPLKFALSTLLAGALMLVNPNVTFAQHRGGGGGGGNRSSGNRGSSGGQGFSGQRGGGQSFSGQRGSGGQSRGSNRQSFSGQRGFSGGQAFSGQRGFSGGQRRGGAYFGYYGAPYRSYYGYGGYYPGYSYYGANYCNPNGYYDQRGNWYPDSRCSYNPYYGY